MFSVRHVTRSKNKTVASLEEEINKFSLYQIIQNILPCSLADSSNIVFSCTLSPVYAPEEFRTLSVWNKLEIFENMYANQRYPNNAVYCEKHKNSARVAMEISFSFPNELAVESKKELVAYFAKKHYVSQGLIVTYAIYNEGIKPQAQMVVSRRSVNENGEISWAKNRDMCNRNFLFETHKTWEELTKKMIN